MKALIMSFNLTFGFLKLKSPTYKKIGEKRRLLIYQDCQGEYIKSWNNNPYEHSPMHSIPTHITKALFRKKRFALNFLTHGNASKLLCLCRKKTQVSSFFSFFNSSNFEFYLMKRFHRSKSWSQTSFLWRVNDL